MARFVLRFRGPLSRLPHDLDLIRGLRDTNIIDHSGRVMLVEAPEPELKELVAQLTDWVVSPERIVKLPEPRPKIKGK